MPLSFDKYDTSDNVTDDRLLVINTSGLNSNISKLYNKEIGNDTKKVIVKNTRMFKYLLRIELMLKKVKELNLKNIQSNSQNIGISVEAGRELTIEFHSTEVDLDLGNITIYQKYVFFTITCKC